MTTCRFPSPGDWLLNSDILDDAARTLDSKFNVSREYHVPYLAGYSIDGKTIYIDRRMPKGYMAKKGKLAGTRVDTDEFLVLHEALEKTLEPLGLVYQLRHQIALRVEEAAAKARGVDWGEYNEFMMQWVEVVQEEGYDDLPPDLDMTPYNDEHDPHV